MGKYSKDLDENLINKVKNMAIASGLKQFGIEIETIRLKKSKNSIGEVIKGNDLVQYYAGREDVVVIALYEDAFDIVDEDTQNIWIEGLFSQISYDIEKGKLSIVKPEIQISEGMYEKYKNIAVDKARLAVMTLEQIKEKEEELKQQKKHKK